MDGNTLLKGWSYNKPAGMRIVDVDVHVNDPPAALAPYCGMPWRKSLEIMAKGRHGYVDIPGYAPGGVKSDPPIPGGHGRRGISTLQAMRDELDMLGIDDAILLPDNLLTFAALPNPDYATELSHTYNRWMEAEWLREGNGLHGAIMACPQNPEDSAKEILRRASTPGMRAVFLPTAGINPLWGHRMYHPILRAAEEADLPVILHSVGMVSTAFPHNQEQFENLYARQIITHSFGMISNLCSMMHTGIPVRFPKLKIVFTEAGISWLSGIMWRLDRYFNEGRRFVPILKELPSEYIKRQMWVGTQPFEEPPITSHYVEMMQHFSGDDRVVFCSDWPHHDFDHPQALLGLPMTDEQKRKVMGGNAEKLFKLPAMVRQTMVGGAA